MRVVVYGWLPLFTSDTAGRSTIDAFLGPAAMHRGGEKQGGNDSISGIYRVLRVGMLEILCPAQNSMFDFEINFTSILLVS